MFIIRATQKLLKASKILPAPETDNFLSDKEWYANLISSTFRGKFFVIYVHVPTKLLILVPGKTIKSTLDQLRERLEQLFLRNGIPHYEAEKLLSKQTAPLFLKTNNKSFLGCLNEYKTGLDSRFYDEASFEDLELNRIEDLEFEHPFWVKDISKPNKIETPKELLEEFLKR